MLHEQDAELLFELNRELDELRDFIDTSLDDETYTSVSSRIRTLEEGAHHLLAGCGRRFVQNLVGTNEPATEVVATPEPIRRVVAQSRSDEFVTRNRSVTGQMREHATQSDAYQTP